MSKLQCDKEAIMYHFLAEHPELLLSDNLRGIGIWR